MSSNASSPLKLELKPAWTVLAMLCVWVAVLAAAVWQSAVPWPVRLGLCLGVVTAGAFLLSGQFFGLHSRSLCQVTLRPDGQWLLADARGGQWEATLVQAGVTSYCASLRWKSPAGRHWALVTAASCHHFTFRRLRVRLRFS